MKKSLMTSFLFLAILCIPSFFYGQSCNGNCHCYSTMQHFHSKGFNAYPTRNHHIDQASMFFSGRNAQNLAPIFTNVDTLFMPGAAPGRLSPISSNAIPIISNNPCDMPQMYFSIATEYQNGRVLAIGHEGLLVNANINSYDNLTFLTNAIDWLSSGNKQVTLKEGWVNNSNTSILQNTLIANNYTFSTLTGAITNTSLSTTDVLILGNDWNGTQPYSSTELSVLDTFVANGGSILIAGLGWSWPQSLNLYPMNAVANLFGFEFITGSILDSRANINGSAKLYNFYPENLDTTLTPYCPSPFIGRNISRGDSLRVLRLAVSTTGEFTQQNGGVAATTLLLNQWLETINDIYGREYCVRFKIIPNNNLLIFPDPTTDPWGTLPVGSGACTNANIILGQQAHVIDSIIGVANYDISHVIAGSPYGGGCASSLKSGLSGGFNIPVTQHEIGHQFSQSHTIGYSGRNNYELGNDNGNGNWTIQGGNAHSHAHAVSFHQLANFLLNTIPNVGMKIPTGNTIPTVDAGPDYIIPISTPFTLTGTANDPDTNDSLTYVWDNMSLGIPQSIPLTDDSQGALFMRLLPDTNPIRTFPKMSDVIANNNSNAQEQLPTQARTIDIRFTVNDNHKMIYNGELINASGSYSDDVLITVTDDGPFTVTSQNTSGIVYQSGTNQLVTWDVNGTNNPPINTQNVMISLSIDGGYTYPIVLSPSTPNNGSAMITLPNISTTMARIKVAALNNIYFDLNTENFEIDLATSSSAIQRIDFPINVNPNPAVDFFKIQLPSNLNYKAKLYDATGVLLMEQTNNNIFSVADLSSGLYFLEVTVLNTNQKVVEKITVIK